VNPRVQMLANNASSDPCAFTLFEYSDLARCTPPLAEGLTANDLVRMTLDRYLSGALGYGQIGYACTPTDAELIAWKTPWTSLDSLPSFLISACNYVESSRDLVWAKANYAKLAAWGREMFASDKDGNGLLEYPGTGNYGDRPLAEKRPGELVGHDQLRPRGCVRQRARLPRRDDVRRAGPRAGARGGCGFFAGKAARLRAAYAPALLNPATGLIAGWRSRTARCTTTPSRSSRAWPCPSGCSTTRRRTRSWTACSPR
jgi:hypothetical protein